ncbi:MAG: hypothetical protein DRJ08_02435 [Acidobacteria bacterium]|nr:MAG: hypothetical protein DRJ14_02520 [Acidobacteriota bacterium]RLE23524.1 MAG: hypothetical protein DRJ08_02435 [Acidobacteriota bacterium]
MRQIFVLSLLFIAFTANAVEIKGNVSDEAGNPVANSPVFLVMKRVVFNIRNLKYEEVESKTVSFKTDEHGLYLASVDIDHYFNRFYLYFHGEGFDFAQFLRPEPEDISKEVKKGTEIVVNRVLKTNPLWSDLQIVLKALDPESQRYKILRKYGFPEKREQRQDGSEKWYYFDLDKTFSVDPPDKS